MKKLKINILKCQGCGGCVSVCPKLALKIFQGKIVYDVNNCLLCGNCVKVCPVSVFEMEDKGEN